MDQTSQTPPTGGDPTPRPEPAAKPARRLDAPKAAPEPATTTDAPEVVLHQPDDGPAYPLDPNAVPAADRAAASAQRWTDQQAAWDGQSVSADPDLTISGSTPQGDQPTTTSTTEG